MRQYWSFCHIELNFRISTWVLGALSKTQVSKYFSESFLVGQPMYAHNTPCLLFRLWSTGDVTHIQLDCPPAPRGRHHRSLTRLSCSHQLDTRLPLSSAPQQLWCCHCSSSCRQACTSLNCHTLLGNFPWQTFVLFKSLCKVNVGGEGHTGLGGGKWRRVAWAAGCWGIPSCLTTAASSSCCPAESQLPNFDGKTRHLLRPVQLAVQPHHVTFIDLLWS